jgi:AraC-like DNA-binding protein
MSRETSQAQPSEASQAQPLVSLSGRDPDQAISDLAGLYAGREWYSRRVNEDYWYKYVGFGDDQFSIRRSQMHGYLRGDAATENEVVVQWLETGRARIDVGRDGIQVEPGTPIVVPADRRFRVEYENWDSRLVHFSRDLLLDVAAEQYRVNDGALAFNHSRAPDPSAVRAWRGAVAAAVQALREQGETPLRWHEAQRDVARALLRLYPLQASLPGGEHKRNRARVQAAVDFIDTHAHEPITVTDIADAAGLSVRGLQDSFQRVLDHTPMAYVREVRLSQAHAELRASDPATTSVADIARRWGFVHMGRFSSNYAARYGQYPRKTLHS